MIRIIAKLFASAVVLTAFLHVAPVWAFQNVAYVSSTGSDANPCTAAQPCTTFSRALQTLVVFGQIDCINSPGIFSDLTTGASVTIDCPGSYSTDVTGFRPFVLTGTDQVVKIRNLTISGIGEGFSAIRVIGSGTLIIENCVFENFSSTALDIEPNGAFNLVVTNSRMSNNAAGVLIKPAAGGSVTATFDRVTIADNSGGGVKSDSTNGPVTVNISNSTITKNAGNGVNAVASSTSPVIVYLNDDVIDSNGSAAIQANGGNAAGLVSNSSLLNNTAGATSLINGGRLLTYGNNRIAGPLGSGFTSSTPLQ